jgi:hypothetical protein
MDLTIVVCTRNRCERLAETIKHYGRISTAHNWELIVVDNNSSDNTKSVVEYAALTQKNISYCFEPVIGASSARNRGALGARSDIIAFIDDDCYPSPSYVDAMVNVFLAHNEVSYVGGGVHLWDPADILLTVDYRDVPEELQCCSFIPAGTFQGANLAFRRSVFNELGGYDPELGAGTLFPCEDIDLVAAASWKGYRGRFDPAPLVYHHHGRKEAQRAPVMRTYDYGRGAYYMKYILRHDTRKVYIRAWLEAFMSNVVLSIQNKSAHHLYGTLNELYGAVRYLCRPT